MTNTTFKLAPWADILYGCDKGWWDHYYPEVTRVFQGGELWTISSLAAKTYKLHFVRGDPHRQGLNPDKQTINTGRNSGYQSICLAHLFGCSRIILLGFDFQRTGGKSHWHGDHPRSLGTGGRFPMWIEEMGKLATDAKAIGTEIINCSRQTALRCFPRATIEATLA